MAGFGGRRRLTLQPPRVTGSRPQAITPGRRRRAPSQPAVSSPAVWHPGDPYPPPAPIPVGAYNPIRDIELAAGKRGVGNTLEDIATREGRGEAGFLLSQQDIERQQAEGTADHERALGNLRESFRRLGVRQNEQANGAGLLRGGAALQSAAKRLANQTRAQEPIDLGYQRQQDAGRRQLGRLALARQQEAEDLTTQGSRAEREQGQFGIDTETLKAREAAENGYYDPAGVVARSYRSGGGFVKVGMPLKKRRGRY